MALTRTVYISRTAYDLQHRNTLQVPRYGVLKLYLSSGNLNGKSYLMREAPKQKQLPKATDDFHFAPVDETPKIKYELDDLCGCITKAKLELFHRAEKTAVWKKDLKDDEFTHGEHEIDWDGKIDKGTDFPEEYITVEHSPYKLRLTIEGAADALNYSPAAWTYLHVLVHSFEFEKGEKEAVTRQLDKDLFDNVAVPAKKGKQEVHLISNVFSTGADKANNTAFTEYKALWAPGGTENGPNIPVFAKLFVKSSSDAKKDVPKAIGRVRLLWEMEDSDEDVSIHFNKAKEFIKDAINYNKKATKPKGDNCHKDRGGKRGDDAQPVFPAQGGYAEADVLVADSFPFKVAAATTRKWSAYSETWRTGKLMGKTGIMFQPSRMAGDAYIIHAYFPHKREPDGKDELDVEDDKKLKHAITEQTGIFQIWRDIHIIRYYTKNAGIPAINFATVADYYSKAYLKVDDQSGGPQASMASYDTKIRAHIGGLSPERQAMVLGGDQGAITQSGIKFRSYAGFKTQWKADSGKTDPDLAIWLGANNLGTAGKYEVALEAIADDVVVKTCNEYFSASEGINVFQFNLYWEGDGGIQSGTNGFAATRFANVTRQKAGYLQCRVNYGAGSKNNMQQTTTHEMGHILFLPHAPTASGYVAALHDDAGHWNNCTMSYNYDRERKFCGLCLLRMRGWDQTNLSSNHASNKA
jgi:hypothetical protein